MLSRCFRVDRRETREHIYYEIQFYIHSPIERLLTYVCRVRVFAILKCIDVTGDVTSDVTGSQSFADVALLIP